MPPPPRRPRAIKSRSRISDPLPDATTSKQAFSADGDLELRMAMLARLLPVLRALHRKGDSSE